MILGRSTPQWVGLITSAGGFLQVVLVHLVPGLDPVVLATVIGASVVFLGGFIAFLANTATTPISDPILAAGTSVQVKDSEDRVIIAKTPPGPSGVEGG